jgi:hypothetical protein
MFYPGHLYPCRASQDILLGSGMAVPATGFEVKNKVFSKNLLFLL